MQVVVDTLLTSYTKQGKGPRVLLLHGWGDSAAGMAGLQHALADKYEVIAVDLPGFDGTEAPKAVWDLNAYVQFIQHFLRKIDATQIHAIIGHSNGGAIAIRGLAQDLLQADRLVLIGAGGIRGVYKGRVKAIRIITKIGKALTMPLPKAIKRRLRATVYKTVGSDMLIAEHLQETFKKVVTDDVREDAAKLRLPTLIIYGKQDDQTPPWYGETYHQLVKGSTLRTLAGAGHFVHRERPDEVVRTIKDFIR